MPKTLEQKAERLINVTNKVAPTLFKRMGAVVARIDVMTDIHNRYFFLPVEEKATLRIGFERTRAAARFAGSLVVNLPGTYLAGGRLWLASRPFEKEVQTSMPDLVDRIHNEETDYYTIAANLLGIDPEVTLGNAMVAAGIPAEEQ